jgi:uncharacterized protein with FMN-binding domain
MASSKVKNPIIKRIFFFLFVIVVLIVTGFFVFILLGKDKALQLTTGETPLPVVEEGVYTGSYQGFRWSNTVEVTVKKHKIVSIRTIKPQVFAKEETIETLTKRILSAQSTDVDTVSGATADSKAFLKAVENALKQPGDKK